MGQISSSVEIKDKLKTFWEEEFEIASVVEKKSKDNFIVLYNGKPEDYSLFVFGIKGKSHRFRFFDNFFAQLINSKQSFQKAIDHNDFSPDFISKLYDGYLYIMNNVSYNSQKRRINAKSNNDKLSITMYKWKISENPQNKVELSMDKAQKVEQTHILRELIYMLFIHQQIIGDTFRDITAKEAGFEDTFTGNEHRQVNPPDEEHGNDESNVVKPIEDVKESETLRQTEFEIYNLRQQLKEREDEIATLRKRLSETSKRLLTEIGGKSSLENTSILSRKMNFETIYQLLQNKEWTEAKESLDKKNIPPERSSKFLCDVLWESWRCCIEYHAKHAKDRVREISKFICFVIDNKSIDASLEEQVDIFIAKCMREYAERFNKKEIVENIVSLMEKQGKTFLKSEKVHEYIRTSVRLCWQMTLQRPQPMFAKPMYEDGWIIFDGIQKQEAHHTHPENRVALGPTKTEIDSLRQQLREKEVEIAKLSEYLSETTKRLAGAMSAKISLDESRFENISIQSRPLNLATEYFLLQSNEWLEAKDSLDNKEIPPEKSCEFLCDVHSACWECCNEYHASYVKPEVRKICKFILFAIDKKIIDAHLEKQVTIFIGDRMREHVKSFNEAKIVENVILNMEKQSEIFLKSEQVQEYIRKCVRLCWQMILQRPQMTLPNQLASCMKKNRQGLTCYLGLNLVQKRKFAIACTRASSTVNRLWPKAVFMSNN